MRVRKNERIITWADYARLIRISHSCITATIQTWDDKSLKNVPFTVADVLHHTRLQHMTIANVVAMAYNQGGEYEFIKTADGLRIIVRVR